MAALSERLVWPLFFISVFFFAVGIFFLIYNWRNFDTIGMIVSGLITVFVWIKRQEMRSMDTSLMHQEFLIKHLAQLHRYRAIIIFWFMVFGSFLMSTSSKHSIAPNYGSAFFCFFGTVLVTLSLVAHTRANCKTSQSITNQ